MQRGFTLVELSIVLVIIGLLVGGVMVGQSLIQAATLNSIATDVEKYKSSMAAFRDKYQGIPGDIANATQFWGLAGGASGYTTACFDTVSTDAKTCDGNNDRQINTWSQSLAYSSGYTVAAHNNHEAFRFWQQLANAGLVTGTYTGEGSAGNVAGTNVPKTRMGNTSFFPTSIDTGWTMFGALQSASYGIALVFNVNGGGIGGAGPRALSPEDAMSIDDKHDDGMPATGNIIGPGAVSGNPCVNGGVYYTPFYQGDTPCYLIFKTGF